VSGVSVTAFGLPQTIMLAVAALLAIAAVVIFTRPVASEMGVHARRIIGTMLGAGAIILGEFAFVLQGPGPVK